MWDFSFSLSPGRRFVTTAIIQRYEAVKKREGKAMRNNSKPWIIYLWDPFFFELDSLILGQKPQNYWYIILTPMTLTVSFGLLLV